MGKENWKLSDLVKRNTNRYNPYSTPPYLRPLKELRKFSLYQSETPSLSLINSNFQSVDAEALEEYQIFLQKINGDNNTSNNPGTSTPISKSINKKFEKSTFSPKFPLKQLRMERNHDSIIDKLKKITQKVKEIPNTVNSFGISPLNNIESSNVNIPEKSSKNGILDFLMKRNKYEYKPEPNKSIHQSTLSISSILREFPTLNAFSGSISLKNDNSTLFNTNPFRFNAAPSPKNLMSMPLSVNKSSPILYTPRTIDLTSYSRHNETIDERLLKSTPDLSTTLTPKISTKILHSSFEEGGSDSEIYQKRHENSTSSFDIINFLENRRSIDDNTKDYRIKKYQDEKKTRLSEIQELEKETRERLKARLNRQILSEEYCRLRLELEGLILERPTKKDDFPELPDDSDELIERAWDRSAPLNEVFVKAFGIDVTRKDLLSLSGLEWLNDEIINSYMNLIVNRAQQNTDLPKVYAFTTFFYTNISTKGYDSVKRWTRKIDIFSYDLLIVPIHLTMHWCLGTIDLKEKCIYYYDSMLGNNERCLNLLKQYLEAEHQNKKNSTLNTENWKLICLKDIPRQLNGSDCGMFACKFAEYVSRRAEINFTQAQMQYFRQRMVYEICKQTLL